MKARRLVIAAEIFPPDIGGPATYSETIARELLKLGWNVRAICYSSVRRHGTYPFQVMRVQRRRFKLLHYASYFLHLFFMSITAECIYAQGPVSSGGAALLVGRILRKKVVVKMVGDYAWEQARASGATTVSIDAFQKEPMEGKFSSLRRREQASCRGADIVIVPSDYLARLVAGWGVPRERIRIIHNAVEAIDGKSNGERNPYLILSIGRLVPWKGFLELIECMHAVTKRFQEVQLIILGDGPEREMLTSRLHKLGLGERVTIIAASPLERDRFLARASLFVLNTSYEGFSHTLLEAMGVGLAIITTPAGGNPELITDGVNGIMVQPNDKKALTAAIENLLSDSALRATLVKNARTTAAGYTVANMAYKTDIVLGELCASS